MTDSESDLLSPEARLRARLTALIADMRVLAARLQQEPIDDQSAPALHYYRNGHRWGVLCCAGDLEAALAAPQEEKSGITVIYPGGLTDREHALFQAFRWQRAHAAENSPSPSEVYRIIGGLLSLLPDAEIAAAFLKFTQQEPAS